VLLTTVEPASAFIRSATEEAPADRSRVGLSASQLHSPGNINAPSLDHAVEQHFALRKPPVHGLKHGNLHEIQSAR
jgi:hypothetical protein